MDTATELDKLILVLKHVGAEVNKQWFLTAIEPIIT